MPTPTPQDQPTPRLPFYTRVTSVLSRAGALARYGTKALLDGANFASNSMGSVSSGGVFAGYRDAYRPLTNVPFSRFKNTSDFLGAYANIASVYTCVNTVASAIAGLPTDFTDGTGKTVATLGQKEGAPGTLAYLLEHPNPYQSWGELRETISAHLDLVGNVIILQDNMDGMGRPDALYPLNPSCIRLIVDGHDGLLGYLYQTGDLASRVIYDPDEIIHIKTTNPRSILWGQGRLEALAAHLDIELDVADSFRALYKNGAVIPGAFVQKEIMSDAQYKRLKNELMQEHTGVSNFYRPLLLDGGMDWKQMTLGHTDLGTFDLKRLNREEIYMAFGVPVSQAGNQGAANVKNDHLTDIFWTTSIQPRTNRIEVAFQPLCRKFDKRLSLKLPLPIKVAEGEMLDNAIKADKLVSLATSEKRIIIRALLGNQFGLEDMPDEKPIDPADMLPQPGNIRETIRDEAPPGTPTPGGPSVPVPGQGQAKPPPALKPPPQPPAPAPTPPPAKSDNGTGTGPAIDKGGENMSEEEKTLAWQEFDTKAAGIEKDFAAELETILTDALEEVLKEFKLGAVASKSLGNVFDRFRDRVEEVSRPHIQKALQTGQKNITGSTQLMLEAKVEAQGRAERLGKIIAENTFLKVKEVLGQGEGTHTRDAVIGKLGSLFNSARAGVIAATETISALNQGAVFGLVEKGVKGKMWLSMRDHRVRHNHQAVDGQIADTEDGTFQVGGSRLRYPGDPIGPAHEIVNCRCTLVAAPAPPVS